MKNKKLVLYALLGILTVCGFLFTACDNSAKSSGTAFVNGVTLEPTLSINVGDNVILHATVIPSNAANKTVTWTSSAPAIATVNSSSGRVTGVSEGEATITVETEDGYFTAECVVTVGTVFTPRPWNPVEPDTDWVANVTIDIYSFNDFHGAVKAGGSDPGAARFAAYAKTQMTESGGADRSLILAAGDNYQGSAISNYFYGEPVSKMMKEIGVKYSAVGNHEWDWGADLYAKFADDGDLDFLAANIFKKGTDNRPDFCHPYVIANRAGRKIGIVGLTTTATPTLVSAETVAPFDYKEPGAWLTEMVSTLKTEQGCDAVIALTHMGTSGNNSEAGRLASDGYGFDAVIGAHSHTNTNTTVSGIPVVQAANNGRNLAKLSFVFNDDGLVSVTGSTNLVGASGPEDTAVAAMVAEYDALVGPFLSEVVGTFGPSISTGKNPWANKLVFDYIVRVKPEWNNVVLIQNTGGWRSVQVGGPNDNVTVEFLYQLMPFDNEIYVFDLRGDYLINLLRGRNATDTGGLGTPPVITNASGSGSNWTISSNSEKIDPAKTYKVSMNDFMYTNGDNYGVEDIAGNLVIMGIPLRDAMIEQLKYRAVNGEEPIVSQTLGTLTGGPLVAPYEIAAANPRYVQDTALIHLINDAMIWYANENGHNVTLSGTAPLNATCNAQPGAITRTSLYDIYQFDNNTLYVLEMTGEKFKDWMEWAHWTWHQANMKPGDLTIPYGGSSGWNFDQFQGLTYKVDLSKDRGSRIVEMKNPDGSNFDLTKTYQVAVNNYRITNAFAPVGEGYGTGEVWGTEKPFAIKAENIAGLHEVLADYIEIGMDGEITNEFSPSWEFILPDTNESWYAEYRAKAVELLNSGAIRFISNEPVTKDQIDAYLSGGSLDPEPPASPITLGFENAVWNINAYASETPVTDAGLHWAVRGYGQMDGNDRYNGTRSWRLRANADTDSNYVELADYLKYGIQTVSFKYGSYSGHSGGELIISTQTKGTTTWTEKGRVTAPAWGGEMETETVTLNISEPVRFKIEKVIVSGSTSVNIDDIVITYSK